MMISTQLIKVSNIKMEFRLLKQQSKLKSYSREGGESERTGEERKRRERET